MSVDLPSSTEPQVRKRSRPFSGPPRPPELTVTWSCAKAVITVLPSEVPLALFLLHRGRLVGVDETAGALRSAREQHLRDDVVQGRGRALDGCRQRIAAERAEAHHAHLLDLAG